MSLSQPFKIIFLVLFLSLVWAQTEANNHQSKFVWMDEDGSGRQQKVLFRNNFDIEELPTSALINLFADSRYHLYVNGNHINFGPSRFYLENPQYDIFDISLFLRKGKNVIAVEVLANGMETFQLPYSIGGFIGWGNILNGNKPTINFETPGNWKMLPVTSMDTNTVKFSFATGAQEIQDLNNEPVGWQNASFNDEKWLTPVSIKNQQHWGELSNREIPQLTQLEKTPLACLGIYREQKDDIVHSFFVKSTDETLIDYNSGTNMIGFTSIYSPKKQEIELGTWWGEYYLNGEGPIKVSSKSASNIVRENRIFQLNEGWNYLFVHYRAIWGAWEFSIAVPANSGLKFASDMKENSAAFFRTLKLSNKEQSVDLVNKFKANQDAVLSSFNDLNWQVQKSSSNIKNPSRNLMWNHPDLAENMLPNKFQTQGFETTEPRYYVFDMGAKTLGRLFIDIDAPKGSSIELGWSEDLNKTQLPFLYKRVQINSGARFISNGIQKRYNTFKPYGVRYIIAKVVPSQNKKVKIHRLGVIEQVYPFEKTGSFECSDPMFNKLWELGWRTLSVCSEDSYIDTPFRERGLYAGDALPEYAITLATSGDSRLMKKSLQLFQDMYHDELMTGSENIHNDFILKTLIELHWYYMYTGDTEFAKTVYSNYKTYLDHVETRLTDQGYYHSGRVFLEWTKLNKEADLVAYQSLVYGSFKIMEKLSADLGMNDENTFAERARKLKNVINSLFWDENKMAYFDGFDKGLKIDNYYPISSYYPLLFNVIEDVNRKKQVINYLDKELLDIGEESRNRKTTPYSAFYLFAALYQNGEVAIAERFMKQYWTRMIQNGDDTSWENFDIGSEDGGSQGTASHAWSGHPTYFLSTEVLGVKIGFNQTFSRDTILIRPQSESVMWAKGTVPHPAGTVKIDWKIQGENLIFNVETPEGIPVLVEPQGRLSNYNLIMHKTNLKK